MDNTTDSPFNDTFNGTYNSTFNGTDSTPPRQPPVHSWSSLLLPLLYLVILIGSLYSFSSVYRKRQISRASKLEPWFGPHATRNIYLSLMHLDPEDVSSDEKKLKKVPETVLKAALLKRAVEDIQRIVQLRQGKPALQTLLQRGSVGDELWQRFQRAEQEMEAEVKDVVEEANAFSPGWGQVIFQSANEINQNIIIKQRVAELQAQTGSEKAWWEKKRAGIQSEFMKEIGSEAPPAALNTGAKKSSSDDDAVLVEAGGPAQNQGSGGSGKKKGKK